MIEAARPCRNISPGGMRERPNRMVSKTIVAQVTVGSNPTPSAISTVNGSLDSGAQSALLVVGAAATASTCGPVAAAACAAKRSEESGYRFNRQIGRDTASTPSEPGTKRAEPRAARTHLSRMVAA
jgi:hypothetical protein